MPKRSWSDLIGDLYDAAAGDASFKPLAPRIAAAFDSDHCVIQVRNGFAGLIEHVTVTPDFTPELLASYDTFFHQYMANRAACAPPEMNVDGDFTGSIFYRRHAGIKQNVPLLDTIWPIIGPYGASGILGLHRHETATPFSPQETQQSEQFLSHLRRALQLRERFARSVIKQDATLQTMQMLSIGVMVVTGKGQVQFANPAAEGLLRRGAGLAMVHNHLHAKTPTADHALRQVLHGATRAAAGQATTPGGLVRVPRQGEKPISLSVYPFLAPVSATGHREPSALIFIGEPEQYRTPNRDMLSQMYGLTGAEAKLFEALLAGERLQDYANRSAIGLQTVKTQLNRLFQKSGSARQTDLVRDGLSNPLLFLAKHEPGSKDNLHEPEHRAAPSKELYSFIPRSGDRQPNSHL
jgi:DNA-binding CsgD family transcriptional regulator/PAS domain-containing protein